MQDIDRFIAHYTAAWNAHDPEAWADFFAEDCVYDDIPLQRVVHGREGLIPFAAASFRALPDVHIELETVFQSGARAATEWVMSGTHAGDFPGFPATGSSFSVRGASIILLAGGLGPGALQRVTEYWDMASFMRQVGMLEA
jgi:steroid delta-isomerase-like uncharacterized protein